MTPREMSDEKLMFMQRLMWIRGFGIRDAILTAEIKRRNAERPVNEQLAVFQ